MAKYKIRKTKKKKKKKRKEKEQNKTKQLSHYDVPSEKDKA